MISRNAYDWEKVARVLIEAKTFPVSARVITDRSGVPQPARRIRDLREKGARIESVKIDPRRGVNGYRLPDQAAIDTLTRILAGADQPADDFSETLFDGAPARKTSHYLVDGEAA